jgi:predicted Zn-dependent protease
MKYSRKIIIYLLFFTMFFPAYLFGGRKHEDIDDIGNRDINGLVALIFPNFVSLEKEIQIGAQYAQYFEQSARLVEDPVVTGYIDRLGQKIVKNSDAKVPFVIKVVDTDEVNAFALPGGYFYVNKGLIIEAGTESELAGVMAHEIAHVTARHATERMTKSQLLQFASLPALFIGGGYLAQMAIYNGLGLGMSLAVLGISRKSEEEADQLGTQYLWNTGYDPEGYMTFFDKMQEKEKEKPGKFAGFFRTHPAVENRQERVADEISFLPVGEETIVTTSEFQKVKRRLVAIDNKLLAAVSGDDAGGSKRPSLKRKTNTDRSERDEPGTKSSRPTLKRP